ncbi:hypothetical protein [Cognatishimia maritima]|nr:hypothetical protein [Cognatishimia maritima]
MSPRQFVLGSCPEQLKAVEATFKGSEKYSRAEDNPMILRFWNQDQIAKKKHTLIPNSESKALMAVTGLASLSIANAAKSVHKVNAPIPVFADMLDRQESLLNCLLEKAHDFPEEAKFFVRHAKYCQFSETLSEFSHVFRNGNPEKRTAEEIFIAANNPDPLCRDPKGARKQ